MTAQELPEAAPVPAEWVGVASRVFGDQLPIAARYAALLAGDGVLRGLVGPREAPRIWDRHLINCAVVEELIGRGDSVIDVGSGAGLPGIVLAIARPDLPVWLVEPMARRVNFLAEAVATLGLGDQVTVVRGRAEELVLLKKPVVPDADVVVSRAVAPLDRLSRWCLPLVRVGGRMLAMKGSSVADEVTEHGAAVSRLGGRRPAIVLCGKGIIDPPAIVIRIERSR